MTRHRTIIAMIFRILILPLMLGFFTFMTVITSIPSIPVGIIVMLRNLVTLDDKHVYREHTLRDGWYCFALPFTILVFGVYYWLSKGKILNGDFYSPLTDIVPFDS